MDDDLAHSLAHRRSVWSRPKAGLGYAGDRSTSSAVAGWVRVSGGGKGFPDSTGPCADGGHPWSGAVSDGSGQAKYTPETVTPADVQDD
jgi:hypothetical protein